MNHVLILLPGVLYPYLTWVEVSHVPHDHMHGVALPHGVPQPCAVGGTAAGCPIPVYNGVALPHSALWPRDMGDTSTMPHRGVMGGTALQYSTSICNGEMQPRSAPCPCAVSGTAPWCPTPMGNCPTVLQAHAIGGLPRSVPLPCALGWHCPMALHAPIPWAGTSSQCPTAVHPVPVAGGWHCPMVPHAPSLGRGTAL